MTYRLYRLASPGEDCAGAELLGVFDDFDAALEARDDDAVALLASVHAAPMLACHRIVGPGVDGPQTGHPVISSLGGEPTDPADVDAVVADTRAWLRHLRRDRLDS